MKLTEFEERIRMIYENFVAYNKGAIGFIQELRNIMPPTCTLNERKFLDEIKIRGYLNDFQDLIISEPKDYAFSALRKKDFLDIDFKELVEKKDE
jgi:hypothetical protein